MYDRATVCGGVNRNNQTWDKCYSILITNDSNVYTAEMEERRAFASSLPDTNFLWVTGNELPTTTVGLKLRGKNVLSEKLLFTNDF